MTLQNIVDASIAPAMRLLPAEMDSIEARIMLLAIGLQESRFEYRRQIKGPARGFWQFELGTEQSRGGVWGVFLHKASGDALREVAKVRGLELPAPPAIYRAIESDDVLAAATARLLLWTDAKPLPKIGDEKAAWAYYLRTWRPGKPHPQSWPDLYQQAVNTVFSFQH